MSGTSDSESQNEGFVPFRLWDTLSVILISLTTLTVVVASVSIYRLYTIVSRPRPVKTHRHPSSAAYLLVVLGSGGHTAEMLNILSSLTDLTERFTHRTYVVSSGDDFSAERARQFEDELELVRQRRPSDASQERMNTLRELEEETKTDMSSNYSIVTVRRARKIHQSLFATPLSATRCLWDCVLVLTGGHRDFYSRDSLSSVELASRTVSRPCYPDLIMTNGPGTGVCVVIAALILQILGLGRAERERRRSGKVRRETGDERKSKRGQPGASHKPRSVMNDSVFNVTGIVTGNGYPMRTTYVESWARVKTLSLSGKILKHLVDRFLVQWPRLAAREGGKVEYIGPVVS